MAATPQFSFAGGEIAPEIQGRVDIAKYPVSLKTSLNGIIKPQGGWMNRPGFEFIAPVKYSPSAANAKQRLIPFSYNTEQTYDLIFGHQYMWVLKDGGIVLDSASNQNITGITAADPGVITIATHGLANGTWIFVASIVGMTELNGRFYKIANATTNTFTLQDQNGNDIDTSAFTAYTSGGTIFEIYELTTPYSASDLPKLVYTQNANEMTLTHPSYDVRTLTRTDHDAWTLTADTFAPDLAAPTSISATNSTGSGSTTYEYTVTAESDDTGEISYAGTSNSCTNDLTTVGNENTITWSAVTGADRYNVYLKKNGIFGWIGQSTSTSFVDDNIAPDLTDTPPEARTPFTGTDQDPRCVIYHQQRRVFGGPDARPNEIDGSQTGRYNNMSVSIPAQPTDAYNFGLVAKEVQELRHMLSLRDLLMFTSGGVWKATGGTGNTIEPGNIDIVQETEHGISEFVPPLIIGNQALYVHDLGKTISDIGYKFENDGYSGDDLTILARHLFKFNEIREWSYHREPYRVVWCVRDDGALLSLTYVRQHQVYAWSRHETDGLFHSVSTIREDTEHATYVIVDRTIGGQEYRYVERLHSRIFRNVDDCFFVDGGTSRSNWNTDTASTVTLTGGTAIGGTGEDALYWPAGDALTLTENATSSPFASTDVGREIVLRVTQTDGTILERCRFEITAYTNSTTITVEPLQAVPTTMQSVALTGYGFADAEVTGLWHLEGKTVFALADGDVEGDAGELVVTNGTITLQTKAVQVHVGLGYNADMETLRIALQTQNDGQVVAFNKSIPYVDVLVEETRGINVASSLTPNVDTGEIKFSTYFQRGYDDEEWGEPTALLENEFIRVPCPPEWNKGQFAIRQNLPLPISILTVVPEVQIGG